MLLDAAYPEELQEIVLSTTGGSQVGTAADVDPHDGSAPKSLLVLRLHPPLSSISFDSLSSVVDVSAHALPQGLSIQNGGVVVGFKVIATKHRRVKRQER